MSSKIISFTVLVLAVVFLTSCSVDPDEILRSIKQITEFTIDDVDGEISQSDGTILVKLPEGSDVTALTPTISVAANATVNPTSGSTQDFTTSVIYTVTAEDKTTSTYEVTVGLEVDGCIDNSKIHKFEFDGKNYEIVKSGKTWQEAAACAASKGGKLAEINSLEEQGAIYFNITDAGLDVTQTVAPDGGGASYVWLGGNDLDTEGTWIWDGDNDNTGDQFWQGKADGTAINDSYTNWGDEPDDFEGQDGLGLAITDWPLGLASQWNDVKVTNELFFVIEFD